MTRWAALLAARFLAAFLAASAVTSAVLHLWWRFCVARSRPSREAFRGREPWDLKTPPGA